MLRWKLDRVQDRLRRVHANEDRAVDDDDVGTREPQTQGVLAAQRLKYHDLGTGRAHECITAPWGRPTSSGTFGTSSRGCMSERITSPARPAKLPRCDPAQCAPRHIAATPGAARLRSLSNRTG